MINLLPPSQVAFLKSQTDRKLATVLSSVVFVSLVCLALALIALKFYVLAEAEYQKGLLADAEQQYQTPEFLKLKQAIQDTNALLVKADGFYKSSSDSAGVLAVIAGIARPGSIYLKTVSIEWDPVGKHNKVTLQGVADTRENLVAFKDALEKTENVRDVYFPASNWIKPTNINFYDTFDVVLPSLP